MSVWAVLSHGSWLTGNYIYGPNGHILLPLQFVTLLMRIVLRRELQQRPKPCCSLELSFLPPSTSPCSPARGTYRLLHSGITPNHTRIHSQTTVKALSLQCPESHNMVNQVSEAPVTCSACDSSILPSKLFMIRNGELCGYTLCMGGKSSRQARTEKAPHRRGDRGGPLPTKSAGL